MDVKEREVGGVGGLKPMMMIKFMIVVREECEKVEKGVIKKERDHR